MRKVELLPTQDCEAGYGPGHSPSFAIPQLSPKRHSANLEHIASSSNTIFSSSLDQFDPPGGQEAWHNITDQMARQSEENAPVPTPLVKGRYVSSF